MHWGVRPSRSPPPGSRRQQRCPHASWLDEPSTWMNLDRWDGGSFAPLTARPPKIRRRPPAKGAPDSMPHSRLEWLVPAEGAPPVMGHPWPPHTSSQPFAVNLAGGDQSSVEGGNPSGQPSGHSCGAPMGRQGASLHCDRQGLRPPLAMWGRAPGRRQALCLAPPSCFAGSCVFVKQSLPLRIGRLSRSSWAGR